MGMSRDERLVHEAVYGRLLQIETAFEKAGGDPSKLFDMSVYDMLVHCVKNNIHTEFVYGGPED